MPFLHLTVDYCEMCGGPWEFVVKMTRRGDSDPHGDGCRCDIEPICVKLCQSCTDRAAACTNGACRDENCTVGTVTVLTLAEAADEGLANEAEKTGIPTPVLRFGLAYQMVPEIAQEVVRAILRHGGTVDFRELRPTISFAKPDGGTTHSDDVGRGESSNSPRSSGTGEGKRVAYPPPLIILPADNNVN